MSSSGTPDPVAVKDADEPTQQLSEADAGSSAGIAAAAADDTGEKQQETGAEHAAVSNDTPEADGAAEVKSSDSSAPVEAENKKRLASTTSGDENQIVRQLPFDSAKIGDGGVDEADGVMFAPLQDENGAGASSPGVAEGRKFSRDKSVLSRGSTMLSIRAIVGGNVDLSWHHVSVTLPKDEKMKRLNPKVILNDISGCVKSGNLMALMGASGAGKTTFLNLISGRMASVLEVEGALAVNGRTVTPKLVRKVAAYIQQQDVFLANLTVYEHLRVQALLRMDVSTTVEDREEQIDKVLVELGLMKIRDTRIGSPITGTRGISGGEAKRLAFASEILTDPPLLFADEPTSGLDSFAAQSVVNALKNLADSGRTIICTIHQPPSEVFQLFHQLLLFAEGRTAYMGPISTAPAAFARLGYPCPENYNHADFYIHTLSIIPGKEDECRARVNEITDDYHERAAASGSLPDPEPVSSRMTSMLKTMSRNRVKPLVTQFRYLLQRSFLTSIREFQVVGVQLMQTLVMAILFGVVYFQSDKDNGSERIQNFAGSASIIIVSCQYSTIYPVVQVLPSEMQVFIRDHDNHMYKTWVYYICKFVAELPIQVFYQLLYSVITYFMIGYRSDVSGFLTYFAVMFMSSMNARSLGFLISSIAFDNAQVALALITPFMIPFLLFTGLFLNEDDVPTYLVWLDVTSFFKYQWQAVMINEFDDQYLGNCSGVQAVCYENGDDVLDLYSLGSGLGQIYFNFGIMLVLFMAYFSAGFALLTFRIRYLKR
eukprot:scpid45319/ scgid29170/ Protein white